MSPALFFAQHVSNASTFIFRSLRLCVGIQLWFDMCWRYDVVRLWWCGIVMQVEALVPQPHRKGQHTSNQSSIPTHSRKLLKMNVLAFEHVQQKIKQETSVGLSLFNYQDDARLFKHNI